MNLIDRVAELQKLEAKATCGEWLPGVIETECIAGNFGNGNVVLRHTNSGSLPSRENIDLICGLRNAAHELLSILGEIRPGDDKLLALMILNNQQRWTDENWQKAIDCLRRYQAMAERMEAKE